MKSLDPHKTGLALGSVGAAIHIVWSLGVAAMPSLMQRFIDWIFVLHHIRPVYQLLAFNLMNAVILVALVFVIWYVLGQAFARIWNYWN